MTAQYREVVESSRYWGWLSLSVAGARWDRRAALGAWMPTLIPSTELSECPVYLPD